MKTRLSAALLGFVLIVASSTPAWAYLDPGTASMVLQGIIGGLAAGAAVISLNIQRFKHWIRQRFGKASDADQ